MRAPCSTATTSSAPSSKTTRRPPLERIEYLPGVVDSVEGDVVTVRVFDRIQSKGKTHTYSDRLAISLVRSGDDWKVCGIEHKPIEAERRRLNEFLGR
jgi:hypothetical protein